MEEYLCENQTDHIIKPHRQNVGIYDIKAGGTHNNVLRNGLDYSNLIRLYG
jgi:hypothetical protein